MYRQIVIPENTQLLLQLPAEFVGKQVEVIAFEMNENTPGEKTSGQNQLKKYSLDENRKFYSKFRFGTLRIKFTRDELYDR